jgi:hypothetical protein
MSKQQQQLKPARFQKPCGFTHLLLNIAAASLLILLHFYTFAQSYNTQWYMGNSQSFDNVPATVFDFSNGAGADPTVSDWLPPVRYHRNNAQLVRNDSLLLYSNGRRVFNGQHQLLLHGDRLKEDTLPDVVINVGGGNTITVKDTLQNSSHFQGMLLIPQHSRNSYVHIFHMVLRYFKDGGNDREAAMELKYSIADLVAGGRGAMTMLNRSLVMDTLTGHLVAIRHANGRDWWVMAKVANSDLYYRILIENDSVHPPQLQRIGGGDNPTKPLLGSDGCKP